MVKIRYAVLINMNIYRYHNIVLVCILSVKYGALSCSQQLLL